ncbi:hypothetical protein AVEN_119091-1 [Araneus ventricosus]|uniref:Ig-like domain-containing protein n=1 Tax=Araneus ventricosus TaxID=182803 RepID=A0A4Y2BMQ0_ARAVE|nr:hypothetical protein AVEN_119091-1 [Araneus ventricosus]
MLYYEEKYIRVQVIKSSSSSSDENRLGLSLGCKVDAVALTNQTFHLFGPLKQYLGGKLFADDDDVQHEVLLWMRQQPKEFYAAGIGALIKRWDKCNDIGGDYLGKIKLFPSHYHVVPALRLSKLDVSSAVIRGEPAWLNCSYILEGDELYSVKWYKNNVEFYRFLPTDRPPGQKYDLQGVYVDLEQSFEGYVYLKRTDLNTEGVYRCEVSAEAPSFQTVREEKEVRVYGEYRTSFPSSPYPSRTLMNQMRRSGSRPDMETMTQPCGFI